MNPPATRLLVLGPALGDRDVCRIRVSVSMDQRTLKILKGDLIIRTDDELQPEISFRVLAFL